MPEHIKVEPIDPPALSMPNFDELRLLAQRLFDRYGEPPYTVEQLMGAAGARDEQVDRDFAWLVSDFVKNWRDKLITKEKKE